MVSKFSGQVPGTLSSASPAAGVLGERTAGDRNLPPKPRMPSGTWDIHDMDYLAAEDIDPNQYPSLQAAYNALQQAYQKQRQTYTSHLSSWKLERQELKAGEENLLQALQSLREALEAENRAHDLDLKTLEAVMTRCRALEEQVAMSKLSQPDSRENLTLKPASSDGHPVNERITDRRRERHTSLIPIRTGSSERSERAEKEGLKSVLKHAGEHEKPITDTDPDGKVGVIGLQRYCADTDSYKLVVNEGSRMLSPTACDDPEVPKSDVPAFSSSAAPASNHDELRKNNMSLMKQVDELRRVNHELWEAYERQGLGPGLQHHQQPVSTVSRGISSMFGAVPASPYGLSQHAYMASPIPFAPASSHAYDPPATASHLRALTLSSAYPNSPKQTFTHGASPSLFTGSPYAGGAREGRPMSRLMDEGRPMTRLMDHHQMAA